ncbi:dihydrodipicolinate synthase family protein [Geofilum sp. OHC36d9]|uniref:dihydrodipicolinate synthase family protein n=1 Tax=Geofilum sp. OHC36d9 TaxID=3458413 RepID=UPI004033C12C
MDYRKIYNGVIVPMVTPIGSSGKIDEPAVEKIIRSFIQTRVSPFILGSTGEAPSLSVIQKRGLVEASVKAIKKQSLLFVGISGNCLSESIADGQLFAEMGADILVATPPAYYPMTNNQMIAYFSALADALPKPLILYNMPAMTKHNIPVEVVEVLSRHENIVGLKDSERDEQRLEILISKFKNRTDFVYLLGWAAMSVKALTLGASGIVPSTGNIVPVLYRELVDSLQKGDKINADRLQHLTNNISRLYQEGRVLSESIPALKALMSLKGLCGKEVVPPMYRMKEDEEQLYLKEMNATLKELNVL